jgi:hypothetical protein
LAYRFDEGQRESIRRIISTAKSMPSLNAISPAREANRCDPEVFITFSEIVPLLKKMGSARFVR